VYYIRASAANGPTSDTGAYGLQVNIGVTPLTPIPPPYTTVAAQPDQGGGLQFLGTGGSSPTGPQGQGNGSDNGSGSASGAQGQGNNQGNGSDWGTGQDSGFNGSGDGGSWNHSQNGNGSGSSKSNQGANTVDPPIQVGNMLIRGDLLTIGGLSPGPGAVSMTSQTGFAKADPTVEPLAQSGFLALISLTGGSPSANLTSEGIMPPPTPGPSSHWVGTFQALDSVIAGWADEPTPFGSMGLPHAAGP
jgi:hypothetical protein